MRLKFFLSFLTNLILFHGFSQEGEEMPSFQPSRASAAPGLYGKVVDSKTNKGVEAASVQIFRLQKNDSLVGQGTTGLITGMLTRPNGDFSFTNIKLPDSFLLKITALGYLESMDKVVMNGSSRGIKDLGNIKLASEADLLGSVTIVAQKPTLQMGIDRKIFNVDKNITSTGGTAVDVMRNIPSLSVDVEGNVQLRNSSPQIFIDGRPTILTLQQIASEDIERVELITNPSAKFDAASSGGIINVVLKKNRRLGLNGIASVGAGFPNVLTGNLNLNLRQGKFNFFAGGNYNQSGGIAKTEAFRENKRQGQTTDFFNQRSETERSRLFRSVRFGLDFFIDNRNTVTVSQNFMGGRFNNDETQRQEFLDADGILFQRGERQSDGGHYFNRSNTSLNYSHNFPKTGKRLTADITYNRGNGGNNSEISNYFYTPGGDPSSAPNFVRNRGTGKNNQLTIQADFVNPLSENAKVEMGLRTYRQDNATIYNAYSVNNNNEIKLPLSSNIRYEEIVHAAYITYSDKWMGISYQAGLRSEYAQFDGTMVDSAQKFGYKLPLDIGNLFDGLFPSLFLTREIADGKELQVNFSRRIRRPNFWQQNPFIDINDPLNITRGNPALRPEYTNSFELNYNQRFSKGNFLGSLYFRNNQLDITQYSDTISAEVYKQLNNAAIDPNAILNTYINAQYTNRMGAELTVNYRIGQLELIPNLNLQYRKVKAVIGDLDLSNQGFNWDTKLIVNYKLSVPQPVLNNTSFQMTASYRSRQVIPQGRSKERYVTDLALRKEFLKNNVAAVTFAVNDLFNSDWWGQIYDTDTFYQDSYRRFNVRNFRLTLSYRFGKRDFSLFGGSRESRGNSRQSSSGGEFQ